MYSILLVDDESLVKISLQNIIQTSHDFSVIGTASNGQEALDFCANHHVDAVITDLQMPVMGGVTFISKLRDFGFRGPILALSNYSDFELVRGAMKAGAFDYLLKADISKELICEYLAKITALIKEHEAFENQQNNYNAHQPPEQTALFQFAFQQFLLNPSADLQDNPITRRIPKQIFPAMFLYASMDVPKLGAISASQFVESVLSETLEDISPIFIVRMNDTELVALISEESIHRQQLVFSVRLTRLHNTVRAYSAQAPTLIYIQGVSTFENVRECFHLCRQTKQAGLTKQNQVICIANPTSEISYAKCNDVKEEILQIISYVNENYMNKISLEDVSSHVHLNKEYLCRLFKKETGKNLFQYIHGIRMQKAADLISSSGSTVNAVSQAVGFSSPYLFSKKFKEYYGVSPMVYASSHQSEQSK